MVSQKLKGDKKELRGTNQTETSYEISLRNKVGQAIWDNEADRLTTGEGKVETETDQMGNSIKTQENQV